MARFLRIAEVATAPGCSGTSRGKRGSRGNAPGEMVTDMLKAISEPSISEGQKTPRKGC